jgi:hypothetical protein
MTQQENDRNNLRRAEQALQQADARVAELERELEDAKIELAQLYDKVEQGRFERGDRTCIQELTKALRQALDKLAVAEGALQTAEVLMGEDVAGDCRCGRRTMKPYRMTINVPLANACKNCTRVYEAQQRRTPWPGQRGKR